MNYNESTKYEKILRRYNIKKPEQLEKSLEELNNLRMDKLRKNAVKQGLHTLKVINKDNKLEKKAGENIATRKIIVTDQGTGGAYCSNCHGNLDNVYDKCPKCNYKLVEGSEYINMGGSDF